MADNDGFVDLVETELRKAGPDGLSKEALQKATGLGTSDLREALRSVLSGDAGRAPRAAEAGEKIVHAEFGEEGLLPIPGDAAPPERPEGDPAPPEEPGGAEEAAEGLSGFRVSWETTAEFRSKDPQAAVEDAKTIVADAAGGVLSKSPKLGIQAQNIVVTQFAERRIWPPPE